LNRLLKSSVRKNKYKFAAVRWRLKSYIHVKEKICNKESAWITNADLNQRANNRYRSSHENQA